MLQSCNCNQKLQRFCNFKFSTQFLVAYGATCNVAATLQQRCNNWLQLQLCSNFVATWHFQLNFWLQELQFATLLQRCIEVAEIGYDMQRYCNVAATLPLGWQLATHWQPPCNVAATLLVGWDFTRDCRGYDFFLLLRKIDGDILKMLVLQYTYRFTTTC